MNTARSTRSRLDEEVKLFEGRLRSVYEADDDDENDGVNLDMSLSCSFPEFDEALSLSARKGRSEFTHHPDLVPA